MLKRFSELLNEFSYKTYWVAYSGGLDSTVLLHLMKRHQIAHQNIKLKAVHINHNLSPNSNKWRQHVSETCKALNIPLVIKDIEDKPSLNVSIENWARNKRYGCFESLGIDQHACVLLAHHQDDQAETFLLNALRGSSPLGLSSMPIKRQKNGTTYIRPLLSHSRKDIEKYATENNIRWAEDESNAVTELKRNYLRHAIIPKLDIKWPDSSAQLARTVKLCAESNFVLEEYIKQDLKRLFIDKEDSSCINLNNLMQLHPSKTKLILKYWLKESYSLQLPYKEYELIYQHLRSKQNGWQYQLNDNHTIQKYGNKLFINENPTFDINSFCYSWDTTETPEIFIAEIKQTLSITSMKEFGLDIKNKKLVIRSRQPKDRCTPMYRHKSQKLKIIFQELKIPHWERNKAIIVEAFDSNKILAIYPHFICKIDK